MSIFNTTYYLNTEQLIKLFNILNISHYSFEEYQWYFSIPDSRCYSLNTIFGFIKSLGFDLDYVYEVLITNFDIDENTFLY